MGAEITGSLPRDGQAAMTGPMKASSGTVSAPGITFSSNTDMGFYRSGASTMGITVGGVKVGAISSAGILNASDEPFATNFPTGTKMLFVQTAAPTGWTKVTTYHDRALRVVNSTASVGGSANFSGIFSARTIARANLPNDTVTTTSDGAHTHTVSAVPAAGSTGTTGGGSISQGTTTYTTSSNGAHTHTFALNGGVTQTAVDFAVAYVDVIIASKD